MKNGFARTFSLLRLIGRLDRIKLPLWLLGLGFLVAVTPLSIRGVVENEADLQGVAPEQILVNQATFIETNGAGLALQGPPNSLDTFGGRYAFEIGATTYALIGLMNILLVSRHTRAEEESGRAELVRSAPVGAWSSIAAVALAALLANIVLALFAFAVFVADGLAAGPSALFGAGLGLTGLVFAAAALVFVQVFEFSRSATGASLAAIGVAFGLRAAGDVQGGALSFLSPIGWAQAMDPFGDTVYWPLALFLLAIAVSISLAVALVLRRDVGAGLIAPRLGRERAKAGLLSPLGLAWRLHRTTLMWWTIGLAGLGATYGSVVSSLDELFEENESMLESLEQFGIDSSQLRDGFVTFILSTLALVATAGTIQAILRPRGEETAGRAEAVLAGGVSRPSWLGSHLALAMLAAPVFMLAGGAAMALSDAAVVGEFTNVGDLLWAAALRVPVLWALGGIGLLLYGLAKRLTYGVWAVFGVMAVIFMFGEVLQLPDWALDLSPLSHLTNAPVSDQGWAAPIVVTLIGAVAMVAGLAAFARRDLESPS